MRQLPTITAVKALRSVFGEDVGTARVLTTPSENERTLSVQLVDEGVDLDLIIRDLAIISAREVANVLESHAMRAADYVSVPEIWKLVMARVSDSLENSPETFISAFQEHLQARG